MVMPRLEMRQIREILRLKFELNLSYREIARSCGCGPTSISDCMRRFGVSGLSWPLSADLDDSALEARLYPTPGSSLRDMPLPNWSTIHDEMRKKSVTMQLLWMEYKSAHPDGYQYTQFCHHYLVWRKKVDYVFRNEHVAGEKVFVDYAGQTVAIHSADGSVRHAQIFIGVLGASNYTYAEATWSQTLGDWVDSHNRMFFFFGGATEIIVPDNLRSAVSKTCRYDPLINPTYYALAKHYKAAVIPARVRKPKDKAKAEQGVLLVERWILAALRHRKFFSLDELNTAIKELLRHLNHRPFKKLDGNRAEAFARIDRPALKQLPASFFELCEFKLATVNINYHVEIDRHYYSVPYVYVQKQIEVRYTSQTIEILFKGTRIASHKRNDKRGGYTTLTEHMPKAHQEHVKWTPERMIHWAGETGPSTAKLAAEILKSKPHPEQGFASILGVIRLGDKYGKPRLEQASFYALRFGIADYRSLKNILHTGLDQRVIEKPAEQPIAHNNIRGPGYFSEP